MDKEQYKKLFREMKKDDTLGRLTGILKKPTFFESEHLPAVAPVVETVSPKIEPREFKMPNISLPTISLPKIEFATVTLPKINLPKLSLPEITRGKVLTFCGLVTGALIGVGSAFSAGELTLTALPAILGGAGLGFGAGAVAEMFNEICD
jgi:hypothetical protein